jgi:hypothetical protein
MDKTPVREWPAIPKGHPQEKLIEMAKAKGLQPRSVDDFVNDLRALFDTQKEREEFLAAMEKARSRDQIAAQRENAE